MGFTVTRDRANGENRWIEIQPSGGGTRLTLLKADPQWPETPAGAATFADDEGHEFHRGRH
jgi:hypothetical protein